MYFYKIGTMFLIKKCFFSQRLGNRYQSSYSKRNSYLIFAINEAERIVGYPTSFLNLNWLLTEELAHTALYFRKLLYTNHPLLQTARQYVIGNSMPPWGLIVLLVSKAGGVYTQFSKDEKDVNADVLHSQRTLAEVTEMIRASNLIHRSLLNADENTKRDISFDYGNKLALLGGDFLLSKCCSELASLGNSDLNELMSSAFRDLADAQFIGPRDKQDEPIPNKPTKMEDTITIEDHFDTKPYNVSEVLGNPYAEWTLRNVLDGASLLGKSCQCALKLARQPESIQQLSYLFGKNLALAFLAYFEQEPFLDDNYSERFSLVCAPVMLHLQYDPNFYDKIEKGMNDVKNIDYEELKNIIQKGPALKKTKELQKELSYTALNLLEQFPGSDANTALKNIIRALF